MYNMIKHQKLLSCRACVSITQYKFHCYCYSTFLIKFTDPEYSVHIQYIYSFNATFISDTDNF
jgi:hypothetical protein